MPAVYLFLLCILQSMVYRTDSMRNARFSLFPFLRRSLSSWWPCFSRPSGPGSMHPTITTNTRSGFNQAGHMYKTFAKDTGEAYRREQDSPAAAAAAAAATTTTVAAASASSSSPKFVGMHAARCFLGALAGYSGSGWLAAEEYACTVLPTEVMISAFRFRRDNLGGPPTPEIKYI